MPFCDILGSQKRKGVVKISTTQKYYLSEKSLQYIKKMRIDKGSDHARLVFDECKGMLESTNIGYVYNREQLNDILKVMKYEDVEATYSVERDKHGDVDYYIITLVHKETKPELLDMPKVIKKIPIKRETVKQKIKLLSGDNIDDIRNQVIAHYGF